MIWLTIDKATGDVVGWTRSPKAKTIPTDTSQHSFVEVDEAKVAEYEAAKMSLADERRLDRPKLVNGQIVVGTDNRPVIDITLNKSSVLADGTDGITATFTALNKQGNTATGFNQTVLFETLNGRLLSLSFVNGVATKVIKMPVSGNFRIESNDKVKIKSAASIQAVE